jgi:hypothetical protein
MDKQQQEVKQYFQIDQSNLLLQKQILEKEIRTIKDKNQNLKKDNITTIKEIKEIDTKIQKLKQEISIIANRLQEKKRKYANSRFPKLYRYVRKNKLKNFQINLYVKEKQCFSLNEKLERKILKRVSSEEDLTANEIELKTKIENLNQINKNLEIFKKFKHLYDGNSLDLPFDNILSAIMTQPEGEKILKQKLKELKKEIQNKTWKELTLTIKNESLEILPRQFVEFFPDIKYIHMENCKFKDLNIIKKFKKLDGIKIIDNQNPCEISFYNNDHHSNPIFVAYDNQCNRENKLTIKKNPGILIKDLNQSTRITEQPAISKKFITCFNDKEENRVYIEFHGELSKFLNKPLQKAQNEKILEKKLINLAKIFESQNSKINLLFKNEEKLEKIPECIINIPNINVITIDKGNFTNLDNVEKLKTVEQVNIYNNNKTCDISFPTDNNADNGNLIEFNRRDSKKFIIKNQPELLFGEKEEEKSEMEKAKETTNNKTQKWKNFLKKTKEVFKQIHKFIKNKIMAPIMAMFKTKHITNNGMEKNNMVSAVESTNDEKISNTNEPTKKTLREKIKITPEQLDNMNNFKHQQNIFKKKRRLQAMQFSAGE